MKEGIGKQPIIGDTIDVNYISRLLNSKVYDKSEATTEFTVGNIVPAGLDEGIALLKEGSKAVFLLPSSIGFGEKGMGAVVPPNAVLVYEIELVKVK